MNQATFSADSLKAALPTVDRIAHDLYGSEFRNNAAKCIFADRHNHGDRTPSMVFDRKKNLLFCASQNCLGEKGADAFNLVQLVEKCTFVEAANKLRDRYGHASTSAREQSDRNSQPPKQQTPPIPADVVRQRLLGEGFQVANKFLYGADLRKVRFEHTKLFQSDKPSKPEKTFRWEHRGVDGSWYSGMGDKSRPLYFNQTFRTRDQVTRVVLFEGEGKADAVDVFDIPAGSFRELTPESAKAVDGLIVLIWPDKDDTGKRKAASAVELIGKHAKSVRILEPPEELPPSGDIIDAINLGWTAERVNAFLSSPSPTDERPTIFTLLPVRAYATQRIEHLVQGQIAAGTVTLITGDAGSGKTTYATSVGHAVSQGIEFAGSPTQQRPVLMLDAENPPAVVQERLDRLGIADGTDFKIWGGWIPGDVPQAFSPMVLEWIASCPLKPLIIVDSLISFLAGDENDSGTVRTYMNGYRSLANLGATVILLHHSGKGESSREYRGSSDIKASVDVAYHLANLGGDPGQLNTIRLKAFKSRFTVDSIVDLTYKDGRFEGSSARQAFTNYDLLVNLLRCNSSVTAKEFEDLAVQKNLGRNKARDFITSGIHSGRIRVDKGPHNTRFHTWVGNSQEGSDDPF